MVAEEVVQQLQDAKKVLAALSRLPEESTPLEHGRAIAERLEFANDTVRLANRVVFAGWRGQEYGEA